MSETHVSTYRCKICGGNIVWHNEMYKGHCGYFFCKVCGWNSVDRKEK